MRLLNFLSDNIFVINPMYGLFTIYIIYYFILDIFTALLSIPFYGIPAIISIYLVYNYYDTTWLLALILQSLSWLFQISGHYFCEQNKPALCNSFIKSFLIAPFFVIFDLLHGCCNYKKTIMHIPIVLL